MWQVRKRERDSGIRLSFFMTTYSHRNQVGRSTQWPNYIPLGPALKGFNHFSPCHTGDESPSIWTFGGRSWPNHVKIETMKMHRKKMQGEKRRPTMSSEELWTLYTEQRYKGCKGACLFFELSLVKLYLHTLLLFSWCGGFQVVALSVCVCVQMMCVCVSIGIK